MNTNIRIKRLGFWLAGLLFSIPLGTFGQESQEEIVCDDPSSSLLWRTTGDKATVYLFGSVHLGDASFYPLHPKIENAFREAEHLVFEVDPSMMFDSAAALKMQQQGMLGAGEVLEDYLSPEVIVQLNERLTSLGLPAAQLMRFRPWFLTLLLTNFQMLALGYSPEFGVEQYLMSQKSDGVTVAGIESVEDQITMLQSLDGNDYLAYTLAEFETGKEKMAQLVEAWRCADKPVLEELMVDAFADESSPGLDLTELKESLLDKRNQLMADYITNILKTGKDDYFIVIGAAHYLGEGSIIDLLKAQNYSISAVRLSQ